MRPYRLIFILLFLLVVGCSQEQQNKISRIGVSWLEGNYRITFASGNHLNQWEVHNGKVTSDAEKGYYYFWAQVDGKNVYVQTPVERSYVEEL
ncbi:MAG: hypothetical protein ABW166_05020 [Sedimenticola sp.]